MNRDLRHLLQSQYQPRTMQLGGSLRQPFNYINWAARCDQIRDAIEDEQQDAYFGHRKQEHLAALRDKFKEAGS